MIAATVILHIARNGDVSLTSNGIIAYYTIVFMIFLNTIVSAPQWVANAVKNVDRR